MAFPPAERAATDIQIVLDQIMVLQQSPITLPFEV
jgi:hypothetical protein